MILCMAPIRTGFSYHGITQQEDLRSIPQMMGSGVPGVSHHYHMLLNQASALDTVILNTSTHVEVLSTERIEWLSVGEFYVLFQRQADTI